MQNEILQMIFYTSKGLKRQKRQWIREEKKNEHSDMDNSCM